MPFDSKFDCGGGEGGCLSRSRWDDDCKARNDAGNQIWAGSNLTARKQKEGDDRAETHY